MPQLVELNDSNRPRVGADVLQEAPYGIDGSGVTVLVYDGGTDETGNYQIGLWCLFGPCDSDGDLIADLEHLEGMLVRFPQALTVTATHELERYGSVQLSQGGRLYQFTNGNPPDAAGYATVYPCTTRVPDVSVLNYNAGQTVANNTVATLSASGEVCVSTWAGADVLVVDAGNPLLDRSTLWQSLEALDCPVLIVR